MVHLNVEKIKSAKGITKTHIAKKIRTILIRLLAYCEWSYTVSDKANKITFNGKVVEA